MNLNHKVHISIAAKNGTRKTVLTSASKRIPRRLLAWLFGEFSEVLVLTPGKSVESVEIHETKGGLSYDKQ
ncbi:MAG: hypothetical protein M0R40_07220 [Firmicutes bacterium]|nr:hypothetical protein [Bacillota bacterium]